MVGITLWQKQLVLSDVSLVNYCFKIYFLFIFLLIVFFTFLIFVFLDALWFCLYNVDLRMGVSRSFTSTHAGETLPVLGNFLKKTTVLSLITPQECVLVVLLCAYLISYFR